MLIHSGIYNREKKKNINYSGAICFFVLFLFVTQEKGCFTAARELQMHTYPASSGELGREKLSCLLLLIRFFTW